MRLLETSTCLTFVPACVLASFSFSHSLCANWFPLLSAGLPLRAVVGGQTEVNDGK